MAKAPTSDSIMAADKMKPLLALSKREPVQAAIGLTDGGEALLLLDKKAKPRKVLGMLRAAAAKAKIGLNGASLRFGRAEVDLDYDSSMVRLFVNKEAPGATRTKLVELVKRMSYQKVEINVEPSLEEDSEDDVETQEASVAEAPPAAPPEPPPMPPAQSKPEIDVEALKRTLSGLLGRIPAAAGDDAGRKAALVKLATDANVNLHTNNLVTAQDVIRRLAEALDHPTAIAVPPTATAPAREPPPKAEATGAVNYAKCRLIWQSTRKKVSSDIDRLTDAVREAFADEGTGDTLGNLFRERVAPIMTGFDESLTDKLDEALNQTDPARHAALVEEARQIIGRYQAFLATEPLIGKLDANTLAPMAIAQTMTTVLQTLSAAIR